LFRRKIFAVVFQITIACGHFLILMIVSRSIMTGDRFFCPSCQEETEHSAIKSGRENLVTCKVCGAVHPVQQAREKRTTLKVIVSDAGRSQPYIIEVPAQEMLHIGQELLVDDGERDVVLAEITSLETDRRVEKAKAADLKAAWARGIDQVRVKVSVFRKGLTRSLQPILPGDEPFAVGEERMIEGVRFKVAKIKLRKEGFAETALAKDILRVWGREL
jgi:uncharacterized Zn finger protein